MQQLDIDTQQARHETRVVGTGNTIYEYTQGVILLASVMAQSAIVTAVIVACIGWLAGLEIWACGLIGAIVGVIVFVVGIYGFLRLISGMRDAHAPRAPRGEDGRFIPVYEGGVHKFDLWAAAKKTKKRVSRWGGGVQS